VITVCEQSIDLRFLITSWCPVAPPETWSPARGGTLCQRRVPGRFASRCPREWPSGSEADSMHFGSGERRRRPVIRVIRTQSLHHRWFWRTEAKHSFKRDSLLDHGELASRRNPRSSSYHVLSSLPPFLHVTTCTTCFCSPCALLSSSGKDSRTLSGELRQSTMDTRLRRLRRPPHLPT